MSEKTTTRAKKYNISQEELIEAFKRHKTIAQIAQYFGCSIGTINNFRRLHQVEPNRNSDRSSPTRTCKVCQLTKDSKKDYYQLDGKPKEKTCKICLSKRYAQSAKSEVKRAAMARYRQTESGKRAEADGYFRRQFKAIVGLSAHEQPETYELWLDLRLCQDHYKRTKHNVSCPQAAETLKQWARDARNFFKSIKHKDYAQAQTPTKPQDGKNQ